MKIPGFIDLQINGYTGIDFSNDNLTRETVTRAFEAIVRSGTAGFFPTLFTSPIALFERNLPLLAQAMEEEPWGKYALGIHIEGPFLCPLPGYIGAHNPAWVLPPDVGLLEQFQKWANGKIRIITLAAGQPGAEALAAAARKLGMAVFLGHQKCETEDLKSLAASGAVALTHLGNAIPHEMNKFKNPFWSAFVTDELTATIIPDGHHLSLELLEVILRIKGPERIAVISDAAPFAGLPPGRYSTLSNEIILEPDGKLWNPVKNCLAGSSFNMLGCMNYLARNFNFSKEELLKTGFFNPLRLADLSPERAPQTSYQLEFDEKSRQFFLSD